MDWDARPSGNILRSVRSGPLALTNQSVPLCTAKGVRVRMHASLFAALFLILALGLGHRLSWQDRLECATLLVLLVLFHELGARFATRRSHPPVAPVVLSPLGDVVSAQVAPQAATNCLAAVGGLIVMLCICLIGGAALLLVTQGDASSLNLSTLYHSEKFVGWSHAAYHLRWLYGVATGLLLINLLPLYPLDGGRTLQAFLWPYLGYQRSMLFVATAGMFGSGLMALLGVGLVSWILVFVSAWCFMQCMFISWTLRKTTVPATAVAAAEFSPAAFTAVPTDVAPRQRRRGQRVSQRAVLRLRREARRIVLEDQELDQILAKVSATGLISLGWRERRILRRATARRKQAERDHIDFGM